MIYVFALLALPGIFFPSHSHAFGGAPTVSPAPAAQEDSTSSADLPTSAASFQRGNVTYDLSRVYDAVLRRQLIAALTLGYQSARPGNRLQQEINDLRGTGAPRVIRFYSVESEQNPGGVPTGAPALASWQGPLGSQDMSSSPSARTDLRIFMRPGQPYWYLVNSIWHELLHLTLTTTHRQTTPEGTIPPQYVNDGIWYGTINQIMLDFPRAAINPITGNSEELYDRENNPWS